MTYGVASIGDLIEQGFAHIQTGPFGSQLHSYDYVPSGVPVVPTEAIRERRIDRNVCPQITAEKASELARHRLLAGDILFARRGVQATGHIGVVRNPEEGFLCGTGAIRLRISKGNGTVCAEYLSHLLADPASIAWFKFHAIGATMPNLNEGIIRNFPLHLPNYSYQRSVAIFLSALDDKIELNRRMNETLEAMGQAIFRDWFVDFGPVRRKMAGATDPAAIMGGLTPDPTRAAELAALFPNALSDDNLPLGWSEKSIGELVDIAGGSTPSTAEESLWQPAEHRWATPKDLSNMSDLALFETGRRISSAGLAKITSGLLPVGTVLLSSRAPIGYLAVAQAPVAINQGFIALRPTDDFGSAYLYLWCKANMEAILANANGSTFQEISKKNFRPITSATPSECSLIRAFSQIVDPMFARIVSAAAENGTLAETRDYLLPRLMSGEVRVGDAALEIAA